MKYKCCKYIQSGITFFPDRVKCCNQVNIGPDLVNDLSDVSFSSIESSRQKLISDCKNEIYPKCCTNCDFLIQKDWDENLYINFLSFFHWIHCNCGCVYCINVNQTKGAFSDEIQSGFYSVIDALNTYKEKNLLKNLHVEFGGGEPVLLDELPCIINLISDCEIDYCYIMSSGITYSKHIAKLLKNETSILSITISAGSQETFKKIKRRDKFNDVKNNISRYLKMSSNKSQVVVRYLINEKFNDSEIDIKDWLLMLKELNVVENEITIEFCLSLYYKKGQKIPKKIYDLINFYQKEASNIGLNPRIDDVAKKLLEKGVY